MPYMGRRGARHSYQVAQLATLSGASMQPLESLARAGPHRDSRRGPVVSAPLLSVIRHCARAISPDVATRVGSRRIADKRSGADGIDPDAAVVVGGVSGRASVVQADSRDG